MRNTARVCAEPGCPTISTQSRCPAHRAQYGATHGTTTQRGYGSRHQAERAQWTHTVAQGDVICPRCSQPIAASAAWDLGHADHDRTAPRRPEHATCNRAAARQR